MTNPIITLTSAEDWTSIVAGVSKDVQGLSATLNSSTSYTVTDGDLSVTFTGTGLQSETLSYFFGFFNLNVLDGGDVTGFNVVLNGKTIAVGTGYDTAGETLPGVINDCIDQSSAIPLFNWWLGVNANVEGTSAVLTSTLASLGKYVTIGGTQVTNGVPVISASDFFNYETEPNKTSSSFSISDTVSNVVANLSTLVADANFVDTIKLIDGSTSALVLTAAEKAALNAELKGPRIIEVEATNGDWATKGHGDHLTIDDIVGHDAITGGGASETFTFGSDFGTANIVDFYAHDVGAGHDLIDLSAAEFGTSVAFMLHHDVKAINAHEAEITLGSDTLLLDGVSKHQLAALGADFKLVPS